MSDPVEQPAHYNQGNIEAYEAIQASMSEEGFRSYLKGSVMKYLWRWETKHTSPTKQLEDLKKARWFLIKLIETVESKNTA